MESRAAPSIADDRSIMTVTEVADFLQVHPITIYRLIRKAILHPFKIGHMWRIDRKHVEELLQSK
jgi:excisionase family DNA binding protein